MCTFATQPSLACNVKVYYCNSVQITVHEKSIVTYRRLPRTSALTLYSFTLHGQTDKSLRIVMTASSFFKNSKLKVLEAVVCCTGAASKLCGSDTDVCFDCFILFFHFLSSAYWPVLTGTRAQTNARESAATNSGICFAWVYIEHARH